MSEVDPRSMLRELARAFRLHLEWYGRTGAFNVPGGPSERPPDGEPAGDPGLAGSAGSGDVQGASEPRSAGHATPDAIAPDGATGEEGMFSAALARALGEEPKPARARAASPPSQPPPSHRVTLEQIREDLGDCQRCKLARGRNSIVFGVGASDASLFFVGEAPGAQEDRRGLPFVGPAGQLLDRMIGAMGWSRETVYIANVLKCRPPGNRDPQPDEIAACRPFLARQIEAIKPRIIVTLGRPAANLVLDTNAPIHALRGRFQSYRGIKVMPTFHPAYLLRNPERKRDAWSDLKQTIAELERLGIATPKPPKA